MAARRQSARLGIRTVGNDAPLLYLLAFDDNWLLVDTGSSVRAHELSQLVNEDALIRTAQRLFLHLRQFAIAGYYDLFGVHRSHNAVPLRNDDRFRVTRDFTFQAGANQRRFRTHERPALTLHVPPHQ